MKGGWTMLFTKHMLWTALFAAAFVALVVPLVDAFVADPAINLAAKVTSAAAIGWHSGDIQRWLGLRRDE